MKALSKMTKSELIIKVKELITFLEAKNEDYGSKEFIQIPGVTNLGSWHWNIKTNSVQCNDLKIKALGYVRQEVSNPVRFEFFTEKLYPDDYDRVMQNMRNHLYGLSSSYECSYRILRKDGTILWFYDKGKITKRDDNGNPELVSGVVFDISEQKKMEEALNEMNELLQEAGRVDSLTQVNNRGTLFEKLEYEVLRSKRTHAPLSLLLMDIDHFKKINDEFGHITGDHVLAQTARLIQENVRITDIVGRFGGEEFLVILPDCNEEDAFKVAEKIRLAIQGENYDSRYKVTISGGLKQYNGETVDSFVELVDRCAYDAKNLGRNRIVSFAQIEVR